MCYKMHARVSLPQRTKNNFFTSSVNEEDGLACDNWNFENYKFSLDSNNEKQYSYMISLTYP